MILKQYCRDEPALCDDIADFNGDIADFDASNDTTNLFKIKEKTGQTGGDATKNVETVPLKYPSNFWRNFEMPLIDCEINLHLNWSKNCVIVASNVDQ